VTVDFTGRVLVLAYTWDVLDAFTRVACPPPLPATMASVPLLAAQPVSEPAPEPSNVPFAIRLVAPEADAASASAVVAAAIAAAAHRRRIPPAWNLTARS
jgi:hypothetical protein